MFSSLCDSHKNSFNRYVHDSRQVSWLSGHHARRAFSLSQWHLRRHSPVHSDEIAQVLHLFPFYPLSAPANPSNLTGLAQTAAPTAHISLFHYRWGMLKSQFILEIISKKHLSSGYSSRTCPVTEFAVASHLNTANSCCHHVFLRHFRFQKCLPVNSLIRIKGALLLLMILYFLWHKFPVNRNNFLILHRHSRVVWLKLPDQPITDRE